MPSETPRPGTVLRILVSPGDVLFGGPGQPAMLFAAAGPQIIRATVEQEFAGRVKEGAPALVHDESDPSLTWRGHVRSLAGWYAERRTVLHDPSQFSDVRTLECVLDLEPGQPRIAPRSERQDCDRPHALTRLTRRIRRPARPGSHGSSTSAPPSPCPASL